MAVGITGLIAGFMAFQFTGTDYCEEVEAGVKANATFNGSLSCYPPGVVEVNLSEKVENTSDVRCVCIQSFRGRENIFTVTFSR